MNTVPRSRFKEPYALSVEWYAHPLQNPTCDLHVAKMLSRLSSCGLRRWSRSWLQSRKVGGGGGWGDGSQDVLGFRGPIASIGGWCDRSVVGNRLQAPRIDSMAVDLRIISKPLY